MVCISANFDSIYKLSWRFHLLSVMGFNDPFHLAYYGPHSPMNAPESLTDQVLSVAELEEKDMTIKYVHKKSGQYARNYTEAEVRQQGLALLKGIDNGLKIFSVCWKRKENWKTRLYFLSVTTVHLLVPVMGRVNQ